MSQKRSSKSHWHRSGQIGIKEFGDSSINTEYRYWVKTNDYYPIQYAANLEVFKALKDADIPIPQGDVHLIARKDG